MVWSNNNQQNNNMSGVVSTDKPPRKRLVFLLLTVGLVIGVVLVVFLMSSKPSSNETQAALAARKEIPGAEAKEVVVADGFALAYVFVPKDDSQLGAGLTSIFRVNQDGTMTYIASASYFSPVDLLEFGIPLSTQAKLKQTDVSSIKQELANSCGYGKDGSDTTGYVGFDGSFNPDGWQIDPASLEGITETLNTYTQSNNKNKDYDNKIVCVITATGGSNINVNKSTFVSTFTLKLQFVTGGGSISNNDFTFTDGPVFSRTYTLNGKKISSN